MWNLTTPWQELILRAFVIFTFLFIVFRLWGKKHFGQLTAFDFVILLIMSEAVQNGLVGDEKSVTGAIITVGTMLIYNIILNKIAYHSRKAERLIEGAARILIKDGVVDKDVMKHEGITELELMESLRREGVVKVKDVGIATLETNGDISVVRRQDL